MPDEKIKISNEIYGDSAYTDYTIEDDLKEGEQVSVLREKGITAERKK